MKTKIKKLESLTVKRVKIKSWKITKKKNNKLNYKIRRNKKIKRGNKMIIKWESRTDF